MKPLLSAAALTALIMLPSTTDAEAINTVRGVTYLSTHVWTNQLDGDPVAEFPIDCTNDCDFTIWLAFVPPSQGPGERCLDASDETPWRDCEGFPSCALWVEFGDHILPMRSRHGRNGDGEQVNNYDLLSAPINHYPTGAPLTTSFDVIPRFNGKGYQLLMVRAVEIEIHPSRELCRAGFEAAYHPSSKGVYGRGLLLPR